MTFRVKALIIAMIVVVTAGLLSVSLALYYRGNAIDYKAQRDNANESLKIADDTINDMKVRQRDVAALDAKYAKELASGKAENDALQRKLDRGGRMLVSGNCPQQTASPASVGNGSSVELSYIAGRNILGIRAGIKNDQLKIAALQQYINEQCLR